MTKRKEYLVQFKGDVMEQCFELERKLMSKYGVGFDTGYDLVEHRRDWMLDWSVHPKRVTPTDVIRVAREINPKLMKSAKIKELK